jgi:hypothetical protein
MVSSPHYTIEFAAADSGNEALQSQGIRTASEARGPLACMAAHGVSVVNLWSTQEALARDMLNLPFLV